MVTSSKLNKLYALAKSSYGDVPNTVEEFGASLTPERVDKLYTLASSKFETPSKSEFIAGLGQKPSSGIESQEGGKSIRDYVGDTAKYAPFAGAVAGGLAGSLVGPGGTVMGTTLGAGGGEALRQHMMRYSGLDAPTTSGEAAQQIANQAALYGAGEVLGAGAIKGVAKVAKVVNAKFPLTTRAGKAAYDSVMAGWIKARRALSKRFGDALRMAEDEIAEKGIMQPSTAIKEVMDSSELTTFEISKINKIPLLKGIKEGTIELIDPKNFIQARMELNAILKGKFTGQNHNLHTLNGVMDDMLAAVTDSMRNINKVYGPAANNLKLAQRAINNKFKMVLTKNAIKESLPKEARAILRNYDIAQIPKRLIEAPLRFLKLKR